ncbi:MAG TPA: hypothetical protein VFI02_07840 [Armatimonadota bacterium]|nr:hypothetical protein [Armatimonadota bacterium]
MKLSRESLIVVVLALAFLLVGVVQVIREVYAAHADGIFAPLPAHKAVSTPMIPRK